MRSRTITLMLNGGLALLLAALLAVGYLLNARQHRASLAAVRIGVEEALDQQVEIIRGELDLRERELFALHETDRVIDENFFIVAEGEVVPSFLDGRNDSISEKEARTAFRRGVELLPAPEALAFFKTAARGPGDGADALYRKITALFNVLEQEPSPRTVCRVLSLLDERGDEMGPARAAFFRSMLEEEVADLAAVEQRWKVLTQTARDLNSQPGLPAPPFRLREKEWMLACRADGLAVAYKLAPRSARSVDMVAEPRGLSREVCPGLYVAASAGTRRAEEARINQQFRMGNLILVAMSVLAALLLVGVAAAGRRQRRLNELRARFIATVSHELRTPLSLIRLHAETLRHGRISGEKVVEYHQTILTEAERLSGIVNNVLDFSRMERGKLELHAEPTDLSALVHRVADSFHDRLEREGFALERGVAAGVMAKVDPIAYSQIVFNLLDNAIKYSDGEKTIRIALAAADGSSILRVADRGIGIPDALKPRVFDEFTRSDDQRVTARRGSGIGLSVARRLAERMGGTIAVADNPPRGTVFTVSLVGGRQNDFVAE